MSYKTLLVFIIAASTTGCISQISNYEPTAVTSIKKDCALQLTSGNTGTLSGKLHVNTEDIPTPEMLVLNEMPTDEEAGAIKLLEELNISCNAKLVAAGYRTTATEDILRQRVKNLRYGLYNRDITYAVYNYGVVEALKETAQFQEAGAEAYARGKEISAQRFAAQMQQIELQNQLNQINSQFDQYNHNMQLNSFKSWTCTSSGSTYSCY